MKKMLLWLCMLAMAALFAACGGGPNANDNGVQAQQGTEVTQQGTTGTQNIPTGSGPDAINWDEHVTFTWWTVSTPPNDYYSDFSLNPVNRHLQHRFNVTFEFEQPVMGTEGDSLALMMGTGRYTDIINLSTYPGSIEQLYLDGIIVNIAEWLDYMPNLQHIIDTQPYIARGVFDDNGRILTLPNFADEESRPWAGFMYRHDILETMTNGNVQFPSGNDYPVTIADWEWMLPLMRDYFEAAGFADYAPLILPGAPSGLFPWGDLQSGFGAFHQFYVRNDVVYAGLLQPGMFEYTRTMNDWFQRGWIHQDFLSRTQDMFFMPNPPLVFGGAAGIFYGMEMHLGDRLSMPEFGMNFDVRPIPSPMSEGITHLDMLRRGTGYFDIAIGDAVYTGNPDIGRFLAIMDLFYTREGSLLRQVGIMADQIAPDDTVMSAMGMPEGSFWFSDDDRIIYHPNMAEAGGHIIATAVSGIRFPGMAALSYANAAGSEEILIAQNRWGIQDSVSEVTVLPVVLTPTAAEAATLSSNEARFTDFIDQMMSMFITGTTPINESSWADFQNQLRDLGYEENRDIWQAVYDRYLVRGH